MGMYNKQFFRAVILAVSIMGLAACGSTSEPEMVEETRPDTSGTDAATAAQRMEAERLQREREARERIEQAALNTTVFYFDFDVADFQPADRETLAIHGRNLAANSGRSIRLEGHADERGTREYNLALGERRANSIRDFLIVNGAARSQIEVVSYGEERPATQGQSEAAYRENRRVEIK